jgi:VanZ family protein
LKFLVLWGPVLLVMALIFYASSLSDLGPPPAGMSDKSAHAIAYAALGGSLVRALAGGRSRAMTVARILAAAALATVYGMTDELHQSFVPNRTPDVFDLVADAVGGLAGAAVVAVLARLLRTLRADAR